MVNVHKLSNIYRYELTKYEVQISHNVERKLFVFSHIYSFVSGDNLIMTVTLSQLKTIKTANTASNIEARIFYPKLILFENNTCVRIVDLIANNEDIQDESNAYHFSQDIADKLLLENFMWIVLKSGDIMAIDVLRGLQLKIANDTNTCLKLRQIARYKDRLYFTSESGDSFEIPIHTNELKDLLGKSTDQVSVPFKKTHKSQYIFKEKDNISACGMKIYIEDGFLKVKCPVSGLTEVISAESNFKNIESWRELVILSNDTNMWIVDLKESEIVHEFESTEAKYYPVLTYNDLFYYLMWNKEEVS